MKKVCILRSNPVNPDSRVEKEAMTLSSAGYDVTIIAWDRGSNHEPSYEKIEVGGIFIPIIRLGFKASFGEGLKNIVPFLKFQLALRKLLKKNQFDLVHACDFDTAFFTYKLAKKMGAKVVFDVFDFLCSKPVNMFQRLVKKAQFKIINACDATIICTEDRKKQIQGSNPRFLEVIHNSPSARQMTNSHNQMPQSSDVVKVCYVGILQGGRLLKEIGEFFSNHPSIELHIGGFGLLDGYFSKLSREHSNIIYYGRISYDKTLEIEMQSDIMLAIYDPSVNNHVFAAPNKFYEALFLGKPIVMVKGTGMSNVVEQNNIGELIDYNIGGFEQGIDNLVKRRKDWPLINKSMKKIYSEHYSWEVMEIRLVALYKKLLG